MSEAPEPFVWGAGGTRESVAARRKVAQALMAKGADYSPIGHWTQGLARVADAMVGAWQNKELDDLEKAGIGEQAGRNAILSGAEPTSFAGAPVGRAATAPDPVSADPLAAVAATPAALAPVFSTKEAEYKLPTNYLPQVAKIESSFDPSAANPKSSARGLFQFTKGTARDYGLANPMDPIASTDAAARLAADNAKTLTKALGREPSAGELYLAHQQGGGGASKLLANPSARAVDIVGRDAVLNNGGNANMTAGEFARLWTRKVAANEADMPAPGAMQAEASTGQPGFAIPQSARAVESIPGDDPAQLRAEAQAYAQTNPEAARQMLARADAAEASIPPAPMPPARPADLAMAPPAAPGMTAQTFDAVQGGLPLDPAFQSEGASQPWMGTAIPPQQPAMVAQAPARMPPQRPADLPAPGASEAIGQMPPPAAVQPPQAAPQPPMMPDLSNSPDGGMRQLQVASEEQRRGLPSGVNAVSPIDRIVRALTGNGAQSQSGGSVPARRVAAALEGPKAAAPSSPSTGVANVAAAMAPQPSPAPAAPSAALAGPTTAQPANARLQAAYATLNSPYARPGERALAQGIIQQSLKSAEFETVTRPDGSVYRVPKAGGAPVQVFGPQSKPEGPTGDMREYDLHVAQEKAAGRQPESFTEWARGNKSAGRTAINIDTKGAGKFAEKANEHQAKRYSDMRTAADEGVALRGDIEALSSLLEGVGTGRGAEAKLGIAQMAKSLGLDTVADWLTGGKINEMEAAQSVMDRLTPRMRVPGSGATSDMEMRTFRNSIPSLGKQPGGNRIIGDTFRAMLDHQALAGDIAGQALRGEIDQAAADRMLKELPSPFARFKEYQKAQDEAAKAAKGGTAASPAPPEARKSLGGKSYVKRGAEWFEE